MNELRELLQKHLGAVDAEDTFGRTSEELIAEKLLEDALGGNKESQDLLRQYQANLRPVLHNALDKKIHHATQNQPI
jgi:hypothetical protein